MSRFWIPRLDLYGTLEYNLGKIYYSLTAFQGREQAFATLVTIFSLFTAHDASTAAPQDSNLARIGFCAMVSGVYGLGACNWVQVHCNLVDGGGFGIVTSFDYLDR